MDTTLESQGRRQRSSRRLRYEAQVKIFSDEKGSLEGIRKDLGLRPSQLCELLKVHPSAWTRWVQQKQAPPYVYQMLEWYLELLKWRGQHHPLKLPETAAPILRQEDPKTYVPAPLIAEKELAIIYRRLFWRILALMAIFQVALTVLIVFYGAKHI